MSIITLTTDYGLKDHFVGALKGKIISEFADAKIIDISHDIDPFNTSEASYIVGAAYSHFPKGTVHFIGVDAEFNKEATSMQYAGDVMNMVWNAGAKLGFSSYFINEEVNGVTKQIEIKDTTDKKTKNKRQKNNN